MYIQRKEKEEKRKRNNIICFRLIQTPQSFQCFRQAHTIIVEITKSKTKNYLFRTNKQQNFLYQRPAKALVERKYRIIFANGNAFLGQ